MSTEAVVVLTTAPDADVGRALARSLTEERLVACVNRVPGITSVYRWEGRVCEESEELLVMKTTRDRLAALEERVRSLHPYRTPEFLVLSVESGSSGYLAWLAAETRPGTS